MRDQADFEMWVTEMPDALEHFIGILPPEVAGKLDGSQASLSALERWILDTYADTDEAMRDPVIERFDGAARYVGEVFRTHLGGWWQVSFENEKDINYGIPVIDGYPGQETPLSPHRLVSASADRRTGKFLSTVFSNQEALVRRKRP